MVQKGSGLDLECKYFSLCQSLGSGCRKCCAERILRLSEEETQDQSVMSALALGLGGAAPLAYTSHLDLMFKAFVAQYGMYGWVHG